mmetsp:Transcript_14500/g.36266  ORF Transcript_14500/g.36266 Transcript_14500/m.36266 type:complete len:572 (-) Transcript_14500:837-2552(-)|eukprot:CAMPEP_0178993296 /NCGR_PEP_ID=MMETSP0795-20121207/6626_1 /TAXON_ID=88552 /ORGANISM="Amoebophrya sp., Strain Ameob2" /LENGTH=571 /DNA_ID=CAMNT_0020685343 /DNA_START=553 /DNA_END=2268 /DNA_ORIENTATION=-
MSDTSTRDSESPVRRRNKDADEELSRVTASDRKASAGSYPPNKDHDLKKAPATAVPQRGARAAVPSTASKVKSAVARQLDCTPLLKQIATLCNLKHHEDLRTFLIVGIYYALVYFRWTLYKYDPRYSTPENPYVRGSSPMTQKVQDALVNEVQVMQWGLLFLDVWWQVAAMSFSFFSATIVHNCIHFAQFRNYHLNTLWNILLTHTYGHPVSTLIPGHNLSHHKYVQTPKDAFRTTRMRWRYNLLNCLFFAVGVSSRCIPTDKRYFDITFGKGNVWPFYRMRIEQASYYPLQVYLAYNYFQQWWWVVLIPQLWAKLALITMNMLQHDGCLVLRELGETPDPYIALGSQTVVTEIVNEDGSVSPVVANGGKFKEDIIFDSDILAGKEMQEGVVGRGDSSSTTTASSASSSSNSMTRENSEVLSSSDPDEQTSSAAGAPAKTAAEADSTKSKADVICPKTGKKLWDPDFNFARDFTGYWINFFTCNNGFHTAHHLRPSCHWTRYPEISKKLVEQEQHPNLRVENLPWYAFKCFIFGQRITWDGRPYFPNEPDYDVDWVDVFFNTVKGAEEKVN